MIEQSEYPDVEICNDPKCKLNERDHRIFYEFEQNKENAKKTGKILVYYKIVPPDGKVFQWWDGKSWKTLNNLTDEV